MGKVVLTPRDKDLFLNLFRFKFLSLDAIHDRIFKGVHYTSMTRRLRKLEKQKLISKNAFYDGKRMISLFGLSPKGISNLHGEVFVRQQFKSHAPDHDLRFEKILRYLGHFEMIKEVILENELLGLERYVQDPTLKEFIDLRPDAVLKLEIKGHPFLVALEYELHSKSTGRWKDKLFDYYTAGSIDAVLYICESKTIMKKLMELDLTKEQSSKVFFCDVSAISLKQKEIAFKNSTGGEFLLS